MKARMAREVVVRMPHELGALAGLARLVADKGTNILAISTYSEGARDIVRMVTDDHVRTMDTLRARGYGPEEQEVVVIDMKHRPGMLRRLADDLADERIDITHMYATASSEMETCYFVFSTTNNTRAIVMFKA